MILLGVGDTRPAPAVQVVGKVTPPDYSWFQDTGEVRRLRYGES